jgi:endonuclease/exonuclease/phosphatase family metal-dependent hydrolase
MLVSVGTFNLNNLFSRFDFNADISTASKSTVGTKTVFRFDDPSGFKLRTYQGKLVNPKQPADRSLLARRIKEMNVDVLAVQEVEDVDTLKQFNGVDLDGLYEHVVLIEGNDPRMIDVGLLSKHPLAAVTTWQHTADPANPAHPVFSRDLLQVEVLKGDRETHWFTVFVNHLKSHFVPFNVADKEAEGQRANELRRRQCEAAAQIIAGQMRPNSRFLVVGDMNDPEDSAWLKPLVQSTELNLVSGLSHATETRPAPGATRPPTPLWTERFKPRGEPAVYTLMDQVWLSPALAPTLQAAFINRRTKLSGDGSDHDPSWVVLDL